MSDILKSGCFQRQFLISKKKINQARLSVWFPEVRIRNGAESGLGILINLQKIVSDFDSKESPWFDETLQSLKD